MALPESALSPKGKTRPQGPKRYWNREVAHTALDFEPPPQARSTGENDELPREFGRFLQTGQPEDEPYY